MIKWVEGTFNFSQIIPNQFRSLAATLTWQMQITIVNTEDGRLSKKASD